MISTPDQRVRVFVSSTMKELATERLAVRAAIEHVRLTPVLFELGARPHPPRELYLAYLEQSHVFVGVYWEQYGWVAPGREISGLEDEYLAAAGKPKLVYLKMPAPNRQPQLAKMIERIQSDGLSYRTFSTAEELSALVADDLAVLLSERFQTGPTASAVGERLRWQLPAVPSSFVGRRRELAELKTLLTSPDTRLVTLVGPGGIGKSRLGFQAAGELVERFEDGVAAVPLIAVRSPELVPGAIVTALGLVDSASRSPLEVLAAFLNSRQILLLLDNVEQVVEAAPVVAALLAAAERLTVLATSREVLRLSGEHVVAVPALGTVAGTEPAEVIAASEAVALFLDRAREARHDLVLDEQQLRAVAEICRRLDGLPLAVELAAARVRLLDPVEILHRLDRRLDLLTGGARDLPERQRTLRDAIRWSYDLLAEQDRTLFARLAVFSGGFSLPAANAVCGDGWTADVLDGVASLVDKSLVHTAGTGAGAPRFAMLDTVREFALERLDAEGDVERIGRAHAEFFLSLAGELHQQETGPGSRRALERFVADVENFGTSIRWFLDRQEPGRAAKLGVALWPFWWRRSLFQSGIGWMNEVLAAGSTLTSEERAHAALVLGMLAFGHGDYTTADPALRTAVALHEQLGDRHGAATASVALGLITSATAPEAGEVMLRNATASFRDLRDRWGLAFALLSLGGALLLRARFAEAEPLLAESVEVARSADAAVFTSNALVNLGWARLKLGEAGAAATAVREAVELAVATDERESIARALDALAAVAVAGADHDSGALLVGAAERVRSSIGADVWVPDQPSVKETLAALKASLGPSVFEERRSSGRRLPLDEVLGVSSRRDIELQG